MALLQVCGKVPEVRDKFISIVFNGKRASGCVLSSMVGIVSNRQLVGFALVNSHLTSLRVAGLKDVILGRSLGKCWVHLDSLLD